MPEYYLVPKKLARAIPALGSFVQWLEAGLLRFAFWLLGLLTPEQATAITAACFRTLGPLSNKTKAVKRNLRVIYPEKNERQIAAIGREIFGNLGVAAAELIKMPQIWKERDKRITFLVDPSAQAHFDKGAPCVFVTAHVGAWQLTNLISLQQNLTITTVYAAESNPAMQRIFLPLRDAFGVKLLASEAGVRPLLKELTQGNSIGLAMDTRLDTGEPITFFGREALTNTTAARLALKSAAALIPIRASRTGRGTYCIQAHAPIVSPDGDISSGEQAKLMTGIINSYFESWIREAPEQWMCLKRRWPKAGED